MPTILPSVEAHPRGLRAVLYQRDNAGHHLRRSPHGGSHQRTRAKAGACVDAVPTRAANPRASQPSCGDEPARLSGAAGGTPNSDSLRNTGVPRGPSDSAPNGTSLIVVSDTSPVLNLARIDLLERCGRFIAKCSFPPPYIGN